VLHAFPDREDISAAREHFGVLYRVESYNGGVRVLVQSRERPDWSRLPGNYLRTPAAVKQMDELYAGIAPGQVLRFRLRANPTKRLPGRATNLKDPRFAGKRVDLRSEPDQLQWLARKGEASGFVLLRADIKRAGPSAGVLIDHQNGDDEEQFIADVRTVGIATNVVRYLPGRKVDLSFGSVVFEGRLRVTDAEAFHRVLAEGIGAGKAFGFGLLSVAPERAVG
jgi:CRISPR system Cascade subunit CasE